MPLEKLPKLLARLYSRKIQQLPKDFILRSQGWSSVANAKSITRFPPSSENVLTSRSLHISRLFPFFPISDDFISMQADVDDKTFLKILLRQCFKQATGPVKTEYFSGLEILEEQRQLQERSSRTNSDHGVVVDIETEYLPNAQSKGNLFKYRVTIQNNNPDRNVQIVSRHWRFRSNRRDDVQIIGDGILGKMPLLVPGDTVVYSSYSGPLLSEVASMSGSLLMRYCEESDLPPLDSGCGFSAIQLDEGQPLFDFLRDKSYQIKSSLDRRGTIYEHESFRENDGYFAVPIGKTMLLAESHDEDDDD